MEEETKIKEYVYFEVKREENWKTILEVKVAQEEKMKGLFGNIVYYYWTPRDWRSAHSHYSERLCMRSSIFNTQITLRNNYSPQLQSNLLEVLFLCLLRLK